MNVLRPILVWLVLILAFTSPVLAQEKVIASGSPLRIAAELNKDTLPLIVISDPVLPRGHAIWRVTLLRSTRDLSRRRDRRVGQVASIPLGIRDVSFVDLQAPDGVPLYYQVKIDTSEGTQLYSNVVKIVSPVPSVHRINDPVIFINKLHYVLLVMDGDEILRSFPIALGSKPSERKLHFDRASSPEGVYKIQNLQPHATFYRAFDLNYPNLTDQTRYDFLAANKLLPKHHPHIGGEIQIHGHGIKGNWTWGCIALRDKDMDWLFSRPEFRVGTPVYISGGELVSEDVLGFRDLTRQDKLATIDALEQKGYEASGGDADLVWAVCQFQLDRNMTVTGFLDLATRRRLIYQPSSGEAR